MGDTDIIVERCLCAKAQFPRRTKLRSSKSGAASGVASRRHTATFKKAGKVRSGRSVEAGKTRRDESVRWSTKKTGRRRRHVTRRWATKSFRGRRHHAGWKVRREHVRHRHVTVGSRATWAEGTTWKSWRRNHGASCLRRRHLATRHPAGRHLVVQTWRRGWTLKDLRRLVGTRVEVRRVMESVLHGKAGWWLRTHLTLRATVVSRKVGLLRHLSWLGWLRAHAHQQFIALGIWGCSHEVHQEFGVAIVASSIRTT
jgi:hypothetical protein